MNNKVLTTALLVVLSFTLTACSLGDLPVIGKFLQKSPLQKEVTLNIWGMWESPEVMTALIAKYQEKNPNVKINYDDRSVLNANDYKERVFARIGEEGQDIISVHSSWVPYLKDTLAEASSEVYSAESFTQTFVPFMKRLWSAGVTSEDKVFWLSYITNVCTDITTEAVRAQIDAERFGKIATDAALIWNVAITSGRESDLELLKKELDQILQGQSLEGIKTTIVKKIEDELEKLLQKDKK